jgi:hypothetical protein
MNNKKIFYIQKRISSLYYRNIIKPTRFIYRIEYINKNCYIPHQIYPTQINLFRR